MIRSYKRTKGKSEPRRSLRNSGCAHECSGRRLSAITCHLLLLEKHNTEVTSPCHVHFVVCFTFKANLLSGGTWVRRTFWKLSVSGNFTPTLRQDLVFLHIHQKTLPLQSISQTCFPEGSARDSQRVYSLQCTASCRKSPLSILLRLRCPSDSCWVSFLSPPSSPHQDSAFRAPSPSPVPLSLQLLYTHFIHPNLLPLSHQPIQQKIPSTCLDPRS